MIAIINYGLGNIQAFINVYEKLQIPIRIANKPADLDGATHLILPGVGAFDYAMQSFNNSGLRDDVERIVISENIPILGVCVGMQMLSNSSDEGVENGLGWVKGRVRSFASATGSATLPSPHMGWNDVIPIANVSLFNNLDNGARFYFLHSYYFECDDNSQSLASADYGLGFSCAVSNGNILGVQFHPEKSHHFGVQLLKNFSEI